LICNEDFAVIDERTFEDRTLLFVRWEQYTPEDDAILRIVWGDATLEDEAWLKNASMTPEDKALILKLEGKATATDEILLHKVKEASIRDDPNILETIRQIQEEATRDTEEGDPRSDATQPDVVFLEQAQKAHEAAEELLKPARTPFKGPKTPFKSPLPSPRPSPRLSRTGHAVADAEPSEEINIEIMEGWRTIRISLDTAMRDISLIYRRSITDLLKIRSLFDKNGVLQY
jgi:hypothetical protein